MNIEYLFFTSMSNMDTLPKVLLYSIVDYLDPKTLANTAQVSKEWKTLVYRPSVWKKLRWNTNKSTHFYTTGNLPSDIHHIGEPTEYCFLGWLADKLKFYDEHCVQGIPRDILLIEKGPEFLKAIRKHWIEKKKPCIHKCHHKWSHVFRYRSQLDTLSKTELGRIYYRIVSFPDSETTNQYHYWLLQHIHDLRSHEIHIYDSVEPVQDTSDILAVMRHKQSIIEDGRRRMYIKYRERIKQPFYDSVAALQKISKHEFDMNEVYVKKHYSY
jgi:hypothetical protein